MITNIYLLAAFGTIGGALFGFDISSMSAFIGAEQYTAYFDYPSSDLQGGITASMSGGSFLGALAAGYIADWLGRKGALQVACVIFVIGCAVVCSSQNVGQLIAGRIVNGLSIGICSSQVCVFLAELAPGKIRGRIVGIQQWSIEFGILIMASLRPRRHWYLTNLPPVSHQLWMCRHSRRSARVPNPMGRPGNPCYCPLCRPHLLPREPALAGKQGRWEECHRTLAALHGKGDLHHPDVLHELEEVREAQRIAAEAKNASFFGLFGPKMWKRTLAGTSVQAWQQLLGGNVALYYTVYIFQMSGLSGNTNLTSSIIQYVIFLVTTGAILPVIDGVGRRTLLLGGAVVCMVLHYSIAGVMATYGVPRDSVLGNPNLRLELTGAPGKAAIALSYLFTAAYGFTWAPSGWIYASEVFPTKYRARGVGLAAAVNWLFNFALAFFVPPAFKNITWKTYIIFGVFCTVMSIHIFFMYPETAGRTLEEIDVLFDSNVPAWKSAKYRVAGPAEQRVKSLVAEGKDSESETRKEVV